MFRLALLGLIAAPLAGCAHLTGATRESVMQADRDFSARARVDGLRAAFVEHAAQEAVMFRAGVGPVRGREAIGRLFASANGDLLAWAPEAGEVAASGELAYTWGWYTYTDRNGKSSTGNYVSIWRRVDGRWRYVVDLGVPAPKP